MAPPAAAPTALLVTPEVPVAPPYTAEPEAMATRSSAYRALRYLGRRAVETGHRFSPSRLVPLPAATRPTSAALVCVYRASNADLVHGLLAELPRGTAVRLWALDEVAEGLEDLTIGTGPGGRLPLLNQLIDAVPGDPDCLIVSDDDVHFAIGSMARLLHAGASLGFDVFQPAHTRVSVHAFPFVRRRFHLFARQTGFVEQGPVVVLSRAARAALLPLPDELGMGWGLEARWAAAGRRLRFGVVDAVGIRHVSKLGHTYDTGPQIVQLRRELRAMGLENIRQLQTVHRSIGPVAAWRQVRRSAHALAT